MSLFKDSFYTNDYDREMLDYIESNLKRTDIDYDWHLSGYLKYNCHEDIDHFWAGGSGRATTKGDCLTKEQFKEKIGMTKKDKNVQDSSFTLEDLLVGQHVVELRNHRKALVVQGSKHKSLWFLDNQHWIKLNYNNDLTAFSTDNSYDIMKVYYFCRFPNAIHKDNVVWERLSPEQLEIDKLQTEVDERLKRINELKENM